MEPLSQLELACIHEAAHAVLAVNCPWHFLCESISVISNGHGSAAFQMDSAAAKNELYASGDADRVFFKAAAIALAGVCAENRLRRERGALELTFHDAYSASPTDLELATHALRMMKTSMPIETAVQKTQAVIDSNQVMWTIIRQFADLLMKTNTLTSREATDSILEIEKSLSKS